MPIIPDIIEWADQLPAWKQDALRRLVDKDTLSDEEIVELSLLCQIENGLTLEEQVNNPIPLKHLVAATNGDSAVKLVKISNVKNNGTLAPDQVIEFNDTGLTIIYGDNGSGKSGYARMLKKMCRARAPGRKILPNIFSDPTDQPASADIEYMVGSEKTVWPWREGKLGPADLGQVSFFDGDCANVYVNEANNVAFMPYGLDLLPKLVTVCQSVKSKLNQIQEIQKSKKSSIFSDSPINIETPVGKEILNLSAGSSLEKLVQLSKLTEDELQRLKDLIKVLADDSSEKARLLKLRKDRIMRLSKMVEVAQEQCSDNVIESICKQFHESTAKATAAKHAASDLFADEPLQNIGGEAWRALWEAARRYSKIDAYPGSDFPFANLDAHCVLCQQPLSEEAYQRLSKFEDFIKADTQESAKNAKSKLDSSLRTLIDVPISRTQYVDLINDVAVEDEPTKTRTRKFLISAQLRRRSVLKACKNDDWDNICELTPSPSEDIKKVLVAIDGTLSDLGKASLSEERAKLRQERDELESRKWIDTKEIEKEIERLKIIDALGKCKQDTDTSAITHKSSELTDAYVTAELCDSFTSELKKMSPHLPVKLESAGGKYGTKLYQIVLDGASSDVDLTQVLSDGELRYVSLCSFLSELATAEARSALVFDDPISSLDHVRRRKIASRLGLEGTRRQVILFTHDIVFMHRLEESARSSGIECVVHHLDHMPGQSGLCRNCAPWIGMKTTDRIKTLREMLLDAKRDLKNGNKDRYEQRAQYIYGKLRESWEQATEELLLYSVVKRYGREVQTKRLKFVSDINESDVTAITEAMSKCSTFMPGHDGAPEANDPIPEPDELESDINRLSDWARDMRPRRP